MHEQLNNEPLADVIPIRETEGLRPVERINGIKMAVGAMSVSELQQVRQHCVNRLEDDRLDIGILDDHIADRTAGGDVA